MSFAKVYSAQVSHLSARIVAVEVDLSRGLHSFSLVGLPNKAVEEARDRISAAIKNSGFTSPKQKNQKVVVSLAPADIKKEGPHFDLGIAVCYLKACEEISFESERRLFLGELSLDGKVRGVQGVIGLVLEAKRQGFTEAYVPEENAKEASLAKNIAIYGVRTLKETLEHLCGTAKLSPYPKTPLKKYLDETEQDSPDAIDVDFADIQGQENAKRVLEIAAAGKHNVMLYGPPGTGKTILAKAFRHILPALSYEETLEVTAIHSIAGVLTEPFIVKPPVRSPHHTSSASAIIGGGGSFGGNVNSMRPGEITLAHRGVLFVDEFPEFDRRVIEALRQPMEERSISLSRVKGSAIFPADFILIATMNPCPCGYYESREKMCRCSQMSLLSYRKKISGPIAERIDLWTKVDVQKIVADIERSKNILPENSKAIGNRVLKARVIQKERFNDSGITANAEMSNKHIGKFIRLDGAVSALLNAAADKLGISMRSYYRTIKIARTIADLAGKKDITEEHVLEALQYRPSNDVASMDY